MNCPRCRSNKGLKSAPRDSITAGDRYKCSHCGAILEVRIVYRHVHQHIGDITQGKVGEVA